MTGPASVLVVDDDFAVAKILAALLEQEGFATERASSGAAALPALEARPFEVVITDLRMPGMDGMALLREVAARWPGLPVVVLTAHGSVPLAVEAVKSGAADFLLKPYDRDEVVLVVRKLVGLTRARRDAVPEAAPATSGMIGDSVAMREVLDLVARAARSTATVLVRGESGTGKELVVQAIHDQGPRRAQPLIKLQCAAIPEALLESELFGYEKGAFTGACTRKPGRAELADHGTLYLDEVGELPLALQGKLLRVLQERSFERLGGGQTITVDVRVIAATHRDLEQMIQAGSFREDLYYRLNVIPIWLPPLAERGADLEALAHHFCALPAERNGRAGLTLDPAAVERLRGQPWPGNVRQLQNFVERLVVLSDGPTLGVADVERELARRGPAGRPTGPHRAVARDATGEASLGERRLDAERDAILEALRRCGNNRTQAARVLGVSRRTLYNKLEEHGLL
jgi:DNA-binding NtrC family response regulator